MNNNVIRNVKLVVCSQLVILIVNVVRTLLIPKVMSVPEYGYWQTYLLYVSYINIFFWGFNDGIYLRYVGWDEETYKKNKFSTTFWIFGIFLIMEMVVLSLVVKCVPIENKYIYFLVLFNVPEMGLLGALTYYYQLTGKMKYYTISTVATKIIFMLYFGALIVFGKTTAVFLMWGDFISSLVVLIVICYSERQVVFDSNIDIKKGITEFFSNIKVGISLMLGTYVSLLFSGIGRFFVSGTSSIRDFSYFSFAASIANIVTVCFGSLGMAIYPEIANTRRDKYGFFYDEANNIINILTPIILSIYIATEFFIKLFIPKYIPAFTYLGLTFIIVVLQLKINVINNTFYKLLRLEKTMLRDNLISLVQLLICCAILRNGTYILVSQIIVMIYRIYCTRYKFSKSIQLSNIKWEVEIVPYIVYAMSILLGSMGNVLYLMYCLFFYIRFRKESIGYFRVFTRRSIRHE